MQVEFQRASTASLHFTEERLKDSAGNNATVFSSREFIAAWSSSFSDQLSLAITVGGSGPARKMYAIQTNSRYRSRYLQLGPMGLYASPGWTGSLEGSTLKGILGSLMSLRTRGFVWNVRFDHEPLATGLSLLGLKSERVSTQVLLLNAIYDRVFADYSTTIRNHIRKAYRRGIRVREATSAGDIRAYHAVHLRLAEQKAGYRFSYPIELFFALTGIHGAARLLIAEVDEQVVAGGLFFRDGNSVMYWHGASDRAYSHLYPSCAVLDRAICWACEVGAASFNFGGSAGIDSLERFKSTWGARGELNWIFRWENPLWVGLGRVRESLRISSRLHRS